MKKKEIEILWEMQIQIECIEDDPDNTKDYIKNIWELYDILGVPDLDRDKI